MAVQKVVVSRDPPPNEEQVRADMEQFARDCDYLATISDDLAKEHPGETVAIYKGEIIAIEADDKRLFEIIDARGLPRGKVLTFYLFPDDVVWVL